MYPSPSGPAAVRARRALRPSAQRGLGVPCPRTRAAPPVSAPQQAVEVPAWVGDLSLVTASCPETLEKRQREAEVSPLQESLLSVSLTTPPQSHRCDMEKSSPDMHPNPTDAQSTPLKPPLMEEDK